MLRELLFVELGTDALWSDLAMFGHLGPSKSLLGPRRILAGEIVDGALGARMAAGNRDNLMVDSRPVRIAL